MKVIDGDGHVVEPRLAFIDYIEPRFRERAPQVVTDESGVDLVRIDGRILFGRKGPLLNSGTTYLPNNSIDFMMYSA